MAALRTGSEYLRALDDGRQVFLDGECVADVSRHKAFAEAARSVARLAWTNEKPAMPAMSAVTASTVTNIRDRRRKVAA